MILLAVYGLTFFICDSWLLHRPRNWMKRFVFFEILFNCYFCTGFWAAVAINSVNLTGDVANWRSMFQLGVDSLAGATFSFGFNAIILALESLNDGSNSKN